MTHKKKKKTSKVFITIIIIIINAISTWAFLYCSNKIWKKRKKEKKRKEKVMVVFLKNSPFALYSCYCGGPGAAAAAAGIGRDPLALPCCTLRLRVVRPGGGAAAWG